MANLDQKHVLLVEDDEAVAKVVTRRLMRDGFEVHTVSRGEIALAYAAAHRPDLVILDLQLPDMHGYQVARQLRTLYHSWVVPILMLTGMDQAIDQLRGFAFGADAYMTKPYDADELLGTVRLLLGEPVWI